MTAAVGAVTQNTLNEVGLINNVSGRKKEVWEVITVFSLVSGDTTGAATIPVNGILQKIIVTLTDMAGAEGTTDVALTDNGDNTIFSTTDLAESQTVVFSVSEPFATEINIGLTFTNPAATATVTVTLRGI